jgi:predicted acetyltransferase
MAPDGAQTWMRLGGLENLRVLRAGKTPLATLMRIQMGQFYGGRSVRMVGIAAVAVAPEARGRGIARQIMQAAVQEIHAEGWPISVLYPSTQTLYRQIGYEQAGHRFLTRIPLASIDVRERGAHVVTLDESHQPAIQECYTAFAATQDGWLDRSPFGWIGIRERRGERYPGFGVISGDRIDGYVFFTQRVKPETGRYDLIASDVAFRTPEAGRRLLGFLADFATIGDDVVLSGGPHHPLVWLLGQQRFTVTFKNYWMLRLTDVRRALEARAYPAAVRGEVALDVADDLIGDNNRRFTVSFDGGQSHVREGGSGDVRVGVRALAALWSGFWTPHQLHAVGAIHGPDAALATLHAAFAGATPAMNDMF